MAISGKKLKNPLIIITILSCFAGLILFPSETSNAAADGLKLCGGVIIPSLFPFFVLSSLIIQSGWGYKIGAASAAIMKPLFNLNGSCAPAILLGLIGGYPVGAKTIVSIYRQGDCSKESAERALSFCNNCGPAFIFSIVGAQLFQSPSVGFFFYMIHIVSAFVTGVLTRAGSTEYVVAAAQHNNTYSKPFSEVFVSSVQDSVSSILNVCGFIILFSVLICLFEISGITAFIAKTISCTIPSSMADRELLRSLITGTVEMSSGIWMMKDNLHFFRTAATFISFILAFGGLSIHAQTLSFIIPANLSPKKYFYGKTIHAVIAAVLTYLFSPLIPQNIPAVNYPDIPVPSAATFGPFSRISVLIAAGFWIIFLSFVLFKEKRMEKINKKFYNHSIKRRR